MPQTILAMNAVEAVIEISTDGSTWSNISGSANKVEPSPQTADSGSVATFEGQYKIVRAGKYNPVDVTVTILYTESATEAYGLLHGQKNVPGRPLWLRWIPGSSNGDYRFCTADGLGSTAAGRITEFPYPMADAGDATPITMTFKVQATQIVRVAATPSPSASLSPSASASS